MSKARTQSRTRRLSRVSKGLSSTAPSSTKLTKSGRSLTTTQRPHKFVTELSKKEALRRKNLAIRKANGYIQPNKKKKLLLAS